MNKPASPPPPNAVTNLPVDHDWLSINPLEDVLEPDLAIVDSHHHLLDRVDARYLVPDLIADINEGHNIVGTVHIEGGNHFFRSYGPVHMQPVGETEVVEGMTAQYVGTGSGICAGIVSYANFFEGAKVEEVLDTHIALGKGRFVGIRQLTVWDDHEDVRMHVMFPRRGLSAEMVDDPKFREGYAKMGPRKLVFDATGFHPQLPELYDLAKAFPDVQIIMDHLGCIVQVGSYAGKNDEIFATWKRDLTRIAELPNTTVKLGGLGMRMYGFDYRSRPAPPSSKELAADWKPYIDTAIEIFGPDRAMFESNFPVDKAYFRYGTCWNAFKRITANASATEKEALYAGTATRIYDLNL